jgi:Zn-dependent protease with chaperone function
MRIAHGQRYLESPAALFGLYGVQNILQLTLAAMVNGYSRRLENQSDRIGLEYMIAAGYDPRSPESVEGHVEKIR